MKRMADLWPLNGVMFSPCGTSRCCHDEELQFSDCKVKIVLTYQIWRQQVRRPGGDSDEGMSASSSRML